MLRGAGVWAGPEVDMILNVIDLGVTVLCFVSLFVLRLHHAEHRTNKVMLRVKEASGSSKLPAPAPAAANL